MPVRFETEWVDADEVGAPELCATWASLLIRVDDSVITRVVDRADTVRSHVYVPLYPLAESLVTNWWFLLHEIENPMKADDAAFKRRHSLVSSREGYAFPNLQVMPTGTRMRVTWTRDRLRWARLEFLNAGQAWVDPDEFQEACADLVDRVIRRLVSLGVEGTLLQEEWMSIQEADRDESMFCGTAAGLGWDPYALDQEKRALVCGLEEVLNGACFEEAVAVLDVHHLEAQVAAIGAALAAGKSTSLSLERLRSIRPQIDAEAEWSDREPWAAGYALARHVRQELALDGAPLSTMADLARALGEEPAALTEVTRPRDFGVADLVNGVVTSDENGFPAFAVRSGQESTRRFQFCRGLAEVLAAPNSDALLTQARSDRQQQSRAFAAELLAPSAALRARVSRPLLDEDDLDELAAEFGVSSRLVAHQVQNHRIARVGIGSDTIWERQGRSTESAG